jgi:hypothetical protein
VPPGRKTSSSSYRGVSWNRDAWRARLHLYIGSRLELDIGSYDSEEAQPWRTTGRSCRHVAHFFFFFFIHRRQLEQGRINLGCAPVGPADQAHAAHRALRF